MSNTRKILVTGPAIAQRAVTLAHEQGYELVFAQPYSDAQTLAALVQSEDPIGIVSRAGHLGREAIRAGGALKIVSKHGAGVDNIDVEAATQMGIQVIRATGANAVSVAEHTLALTMAVIKQLRPLDQTLRRGDWEKLSFASREMAGMRVGLIGAGAIAQATARLFRGIGMSVVAYDPYPPLKVFEEMGAQRSGSVQKMLPLVDIVSLHCPLTEETRHILNAKSLALLPKGSFVINAARGGLVDEAALLDALVSRHIAGAGLDVFEVEPPRRDNPLFKARDLIVTPHIGASTHEAMDRVACAAVQGIIDYVEGRRIAANRLVNKIEFETAAT